jgi:hypothetical protein
MRKYIFIILIITNIYCLERYRYEFAEYYTDVADNYYFKILNLLGIVVMIQHQRYKAPHSLQKYISDIEYLRNTFSFHEKHCPYAIDSIFKGLIIEITHYSLITCISHCFMMMRAVPFFILLIMTGAVVLRLKL